MNGKTVVLSAAPPATPHAATLPFATSARTIAASVSPPTLSTAPAQRSESSGRLDGAVSVLRSRISLAPSDRR